MVNNGSGGAEVSNDNPENSDEGIVASGEGGSKTRLFLSREAIVSAAEQALREGSAREWSVRKLARTLDCSPSALYRHFPGGFEELQAIVRARILSRLVAQLDAAEEDVNAHGFACLDATTYASKLVRSWRAFLAFADANKAEYLQLFGLVRARDPQDANDTVQLAMIERYASLIQAAAMARELERPRIGAEEATRIGALLWVQLQGFANMRLNGIEVAYNRDLEIRLLINGLVIACFAVASTPVGLEAAATAAMNGSRFKPLTPERSPATS